MFLYTDLVSGDRMFSGAFPVQEADGLVYEVDCRRVQGTEDSYVDIGADDSDHDERKTEFETISSFVETFQLQEIALDQELYSAYTCDYLTAIERRLMMTNPGRVREFRKGAEEKVKQTLENFTNLCFFTGRSRDPNGMIAVLDHRPDSGTPFLSFWKDGTARWTTESVKVLDALLQSQKD